MADCKDKISTKKCKKLKKKGKCEDKKTYKKCMETCQRCTPGIIEVFNYTNSLLNTTFASGKKLCSQI